MYPPVGTIRREYFLLPFAEIVGGFFETRRFGAAIQNIERLQIRLEGGIPLPDPWWPQTLSRMRMRVAPALAIRFTAALTTAGFVKCVSPNGRFARR